MTLPTNPSGSGSDKHSSSQSINDGKSLSPNSSPRNSPKPSPQPQHKREHSRSDCHLSTSFRENHVAHGRNDLTPNQENVSLRASELSIPDLNRSISQDSSVSNSSKGQKEHKSSERPKKKSSWYNVLYPTYKSRSADFKNTFMDIPDDERLIVDYSCALQKEILVHGRLYITQNYLCFYANIFGWESTVITLWKNVAAITKEKTALVIPNAIFVCTSSEKFFFTSFTSRDKTYLILFRLWQNALMDQPMSSQEMWQLIHQCYGEELGLTSDDEDYVTPGSEDLKLSARISVESFSEECQSTGDPLLDSVNLDNKVDESLPLFIHLHNSPEAHLPTDMSDTTESDVERNTRFDESNPIIVTCTNNHEGRQMLKETFPIHVDQLFTLLFTNSKFYLDFHASRQTADLTQTAWVHNSATGQKSRVINLTVPITQPIGPKSTQVTETQVMLPCSKPGHLYSIDVESINSGIPYADSFYIGVHYCLERISENESLLVIYAQIKYRKSVWGLVKTMIEKNCWQGLDEFFSSLNKALMVDCEEAIHPIIKRKSRKRRKVPIIIDDGIARSTVTGTKIRMRPLPPRPPQNECLMWTVFLVLILLVVLNVALYYKLWSLEEAQPYTLLDLHVLKEPPKSHEEWLKLLQQQETLHSVEMQKWQRVLKTAVKLLRQAEESLNELQHSIHPTSSDKIMSVLKNQNDFIPSPTDESKHDEL